MPRGLRPSASQRHRPLEALGRVLGGCGARWGEATALKPSDIDLGSNTVRITRAWKRTYERGGYELGPPKTKKSVRTINVPKVTLEKLDLTGEWGF